MLTGAQIEIEMREAKVAVLPGREDQDVDLRRAASPARRSAGPPGETTEVTFVHRLPAKAGELTVHLHGGHNRAAEDGQPGGLTKRPAAGAVLQHLPQPRAGRVRQRPADRTRAAGARTATT